MANSVSDGPLDHENATNIIFNATFFFKLKLLHFWPSEFLLSLRALSTQLSQFLMHFKSIDQVVPPAKYSPLTKLAIRAGERDSNIDETRQRTEGRTIRKPTGPTLCNCTMIRAKLCHTSI